MLFAYSVFCLGCGLTQAAANRTPSLVTHATILDAPMWFSSKSSKLVVGGIAFIALISEIILGFLLIGWWAGLLFWLPAAFLAQITTPKKNPAIPFFLGIVVIFIGTIMILNAGSY